MEYRKKVIKWALDFLPRINARVKEYSWVKEWLPNYYDFRVECEYMGNRVTGRGIDCDKNLAFIKSVSEFLERLYPYCYHARVNIVCHVDKGKLCSKVIEETLERDSFYCHVMTQTPFRKITKLSNKVNEIKEKLIERNIGLEVYALRCSHQPIYCALIQGINAKPPFQYILGLGSGDNYNNAITKAVIEALSNTVAHLYKPLDPLSVDEYLQNPTADLAKIRLGLSLISDHGIAPLLNSEKKQQSSDTPIIDIEYLPIPSLLGNVCPFVFGSPISEEVQFPFQGKPNKNNTNLSRLSKFVGHEMMMDDVFKDPVILG